MMFDKEDNWSDFPGYKVPGVLWARADVKQEGVAFEATYNGKSWKIRINDFPDEPHYTLIVEGVEIVHFNDWPSEWVRPKFLNNNK